MRLGIGRLVAQRPGRTPTEQRLETGVGEREPETALKARLDVAHLTQFLPAFGGAPTGIEARGRLMLSEVLCSEHAATDGLVDALDLGHIERTGRITHQHRARHLHLGERLPTARSDGAGTRGEDLTALEQRLDARMVLELLESLEGLQARIAVVESDHIADIHAVVVEVVEEAATVGAGVERPADAVLDETRLDPARRQLP